MGALQEFKCPCCGADVEFDSASQKMKCPYCGIELSEPVAEIHIKNKWCVKAKSTELTDSKPIEKMNKEELLVKAAELGIEIEDKNQITKAQLIEMINNANQE